MNRRNKRVILRYQTERILQEIEASSAEVVKVTHELIEAGATNQEGTPGSPNPSGWNARQLDILGIPWPPFQGWKSAAANRLRITKEEAIRFLRLRGKSKAVTG